MILELYYMLPNQAIIYNNVLRNNTGDVIDNTRTAIYVLTVLLEIVCTKTAPAIDYVPPLFERMMHVLWFTSCLQYERVSARQKQFLMTDEIRFF